MTHTGKVILGVVSTVFILIKLVLTGLDAGECKKRKEVLINMIHVTGYLITLIFILNV